MAGPQLSAARERVVAVAHADARTIDDLPEHASATDVARSIGRLVDARRAAAVAELKQSVDAMQASWDEMLGAEAAYSEALWSILVEKRTEVIDRDYATAGSVVIRTRIGRRQLEVLMAGGPRFTADGLRGPEALARLWPEAETFRMPRVPPHLALHPE